VSVSLRVRREQIGLDTRRFADDRQVDFEELLRARAGALVVEPPMATVGQYPPLDSAVGGDLDAREITQHLRRGHAVVEQVRLAPAIEVTLPFLGFDDRDSGFVAIRFLGALDPRQRRLILEQEVVWNIGAMLGSRLLGQEMIPAERLQDGIDQLALGRRLIGVFDARKTAIGIP
jgi:hypothetical protein